MTLSPIARPLVRVFVPVCEISHLDENPMRLETLRTWTYGGLHGQGSGTPQYK